MEIRIKRVYDPPSSEDGIRILTERLWPRGLSKEKAAVDQWAKEWAPSHELRKWYGHREERWPDFQARYRAELSVDGSRLAEWAESLTSHPRVTFVYGSKGQLISSVVLKAVVEELLA